jgi:hypothetical protein
LQERGADLRRVLMSIRAEASARSFGPPEKAV